MREVQKNCVLELSFLSSKNYRNSFDNDFGIIVTEPDGGEKTAPGFWAGKRNWKARYSSQKTGAYSYQTFCSDGTDRGLNGRNGTFKVVPYRGDNPLFRHGKLRTAKQTRSLEHANGTPFFWLGDTWWMGFTKRLKWPGEFKLLTADRVKKGFSLIQIIAGLYPDMPPFDERGANEAGFPWKKDYSEINPVYFNHTDVKVSWLANSGLVPCIVGFWGYFMKFAGKEVLKKHWKNLIARYGAYPVVWCVAGEAMMLYYLDENRKKWTEKDSAKLKSDWSDVTKYIRQTDCFKNPVTIHPTRYGHEQLDRPSLLDIDMLQTGHDFIGAPARTAESVTHSLKKHNMPVVVGETCYEGIMETSRQETERNLFWTTMLSGAKGFTYGANGIWQLNRREKSFGPSPHGHSWGETPWEDAYKLPGSLHVGVGKKILEKYPWTEIQPHPEWVDADRKLCAGIPKKLRIIYVTDVWGFKVAKIEKGIKYNAFLIDPKNGKRRNLGTVKPDKKGNWRPKSFFIFQDWILVLKKI